MDSPRNHVVGSTFIPLKAAPRPQPAGLSETWPIWPDKRCKIICRCLVNMWYLRSGPHPPQKWFLNQWITLWHGLRILMDSSHFLTHAGLQDLIFHAPDQFRCALDGQLMMDPLRTPQVCRGSLLGWKCDTESPLRLWLFNTFYEWKLKSGATWPFTISNGADSSAVEENPFFYQISLVFARAWSLNDRVFYKFLRGLRESVLALARTKPDSLCEK